MSNKLQNHWGMDYETLANCFVGVFSHYKDPSNRKIFIISELQNDLKELYDFLLECRTKKQYHISYNGINFDSQISEYILQNYAQLSKMSNPAERLYSLAQEVIESEKRKYKSSIPQIDLFLLNHWNNKAKSASLKWIQFSLDWKNIMDMPIHHSTIITDKASIDDVTTYCINDVTSTLAIYDWSKKQVQLRKTLSIEYGMDLMSASEAKISREIFLKLLSEKTGIKKWELKNYKTKRYNIKVSEVIADYVKFSTPTFQHILNEFNNLNVNPLKTKDGFKYNTLYKGVELIYGLGGLHGANVKGVYKSDDDIVIMSSDVSSFYPNLAIKNNWAPAHLPREEFCDLYESFYLERKKIPKSDPRNYTYKIILNSTYGLSNEENSFLYDPKYTMQITINGQLSLTMLLEMICERIPESIPIIQNTDGLETAIPRKYVDEYLKICKEWEDITNLDLEHTTYKKLILSDVNNYIAVDENDEVKHKGRFEVDYSSALHKNKSSLIVPKAIHEYFVNGTPVKDTIMNSRNIFDFCIGKRVRGAWFHCNLGIDSNGNLTCDELQGTLRFIISNEGSKIVKKSITDDRTINLISGPWKQRLLINHDPTTPWDEYNINYRYYIRAAEKEIHSIQEQSLKLELF